MSELVADSAPAEARQAGVRAARVWQPIDLLHPITAPSGFLNSPWRSAPIPFFNLTDFGSPAPKTANDLAFPAGDASQAQTGQDAKPEPASAEPEPLAADITQALAQARAEGRAQGETETRAALQAEMDSTLQTRLANDQSLVQAVQAALAQFEQRTDQLYEPLKRLALHLAEQLVLGELSLDGKAIERLVQSCIDELVHHDASPVQVELHSSDLAAWQSLNQRHGLPPGAGLRLLANDGLERGSVRASANDRRIEDLILNRLSGLARVLGINEASWRARSAFNPERILSEGLTPDTVLPLTTHRPTHSSAEVMLAATDSPDSSDVSQLADSLDELPALDQPRSGHG